MNTKDTLKHGLLYGGGMGAGAIAGNEIVNNWPVISKAIGAGVAGTSPLDVMLGYPAVIDAGILANTAREEAQKAYLENVKAEQSTRIADALEKVYGSAKRK